MTKYEYMRQTKEHGILRCETVPQWLDSIGSYGWRLCAIDGEWYIFCREKQNA